MEKIKRFFRRELFDHGLYEYGICTVVSGGKLWVEISQVTAPVSSHKELAARAVHRL